LKFIWLIAAACVVLVVLLLLVPSSVDRAQSSVLALGGGDAQAPADELNTPLDDRGAPVEQRSVADKAAVVESPRHDVPAALQKTIDHRESICGHVHVRPGSRYALEHGTVTANLEQPGFGARLDHEQLLRMQQPQSTTFAKDGRFSIDNLSPGVWKVRCEAPGFPAVERRFSLGSDPPLEIELGERQDLCVRLVDASGRPLSDPLPDMKFAIADVLDLFVSSVLPVRGERPNSHGGALTFRAGRVEPGSSKWFQIHDLTTAETMWVGAALGECTLAFVEISADSEDVTLVVSPDLVRDAMGRIDVSVVDAQNERPLDGVKLELAGGPPKLWPPQTTDLRGQAAFQSLLPQSYDVAAELAGYASVHSSIAVSTGQRAHLELRLERAVSISGVLQALPDGRSIGHVNLAWVSANARDAIATRTVKTKADGNFSFDGLSPREYIVTASAVTIPQKMFAHLGTSKLPEDCVYVDARLGSISGIVLSQPKPDARLLDGRQ
jgi:hypothetical protein